MRFEVIGSRRENRIFPPAFSPPLKGGRGDFERNPVLDRFSRSLKSAFGKIDSFIAAFADMFLIELIGENFH